MWAENSGCIKEHDAESLSLMIDVGLFILGLLNWLMNLTNSFC